MPRPENSERPVHNLRLLTPDLVDTILSEARGLLQRHGFVTRNPEALELAQRHGLDVDLRDGRIRIGEETIAKCVESAPKEILLYNRQGEPAMRLSGDAAHFNPGSAAISIVDAGARSSQPPTLADCVRLARLTQCLEHLAGQSTGLVPADVPGHVADSFRLLVALLYCEKPVVTGTFRRGSAALMREMLLAVRGTDTDLRAKPLAVFDCCPSPPLRWGDHTVQDLMDCARWGIPTELVSMPAMGSVAPVTLVGALIQHTAESLTGIVLSQLAAPGAPVIYGGSPSLFDMQYMTTPMGAIESVMLACAHAQIGKHLLLPTHAYLGLSDSKVVDCQAGLETAAGALLGALAGVNNMSGPGMLEFESCFSLEKLVIDNDVCGMALRLARGIAPVEGELPSNDLFADLLLSGHCLDHEHTLRHFRRHSYPTVLDRAHRDEWLSKGGYSSERLASFRVETLLAQEEFRLPEPDVVRALVEIANLAAPECKPLVTAWLV